MFAFIFKSLIVIADFGKLANLSTVWDPNEIFWGNIRLMGWFFFSVEMETFAKISIYFLYHCADIYKISFVIFFKCYICIWDNLVF